MNGTKIKEIKEIKKMTETEETEDTKKILFVSNETERFMTNENFHEAIITMFENNHKYDSNIDMRIILPLNEKIITKFSDRLKFIGRIDVEYGLNYKCCGIFTFIEGDVIYYFLENDYYLNNVYHYIFVNDDIKFTFFGNAVLALLEHIDFMPNIFRWEFC